MPASLTRLLDSPLFEPFLLREATRRAQELSAAAQARMKPWVAAAQARYRVALELRDRGTQGVALGLLREAAFFALCAVQVAESQSGAPSPSAQAAWARFSALPEPAGAPALLASVSRAFGSAEPLALDILDPADAQALRPAAEETVAWLLGLAEVRSPAQLARSRSVRTLLLLLSLLLLSWAGLNYWLALSALSARSS